MLQAMTAGSGALVGSFAGPAGTALGASIGLGIDYAANKGVELIQREEFVREVQGMVMSTKKAYSNILATELHRAINVLIQDAMQLIPKAVEQQRK